MTRYNRRLQLLAACLSALAGFVDALGFLQLGGFFVSFMSGNSTRLAVGISQASGQAGIAAALIAAFVLGVVMGSFVGHVAGTRRRPIVLTFVALLLAVAATLHNLGASAVTVAIMALAMGAENAVFERDGEVTIGLTYMTGALVKLGQRVAGAWLGGDPFGWSPYLLLWLGLVAGAVAGALVFPWVGLSGLWIASAAAAVLAMVAACLGTDGS